MLFRSSKGFYVNVPKKELDRWPADPRFPIARYMSWTRPNGTQTEYSIPEPDNFNRAVMALRRLTCPFIEDHIFYYDTLRSSWWTVYYVPPSRLQEFDLWVDQQEYIIRWYHSKPAAVRTRKSLLYNRVNSYEITDNERLYTMGYYNKLAEKYFKEDDRPLLDRLGSVRKELLDFRTDE